MSFQFLFCCEDDGDEEEEDDEDDEEESEGQDEEEEEEGRKDGDVGEEVSESESDDDSDKCPICLLQFRDNDIGVPESCDHTFCLDCLQEWAKVSGISEYPLILKDAQDHPGINPSCIDDKIILFSSQFF